MKVGLFIPCYINAIYPNVGVASYRLLKSLGVDVDYPLDQTCCGQPMANAGFEGESAKLALRFDDLFREYDYIVGPSASCVAFVKENHPGILKKEGHVCQSAGKIYDLCDFIHDVIKPSKLPARFPHKVSIHNSCHGVRELFNSAPSELNIPYYNKLRDLLNLVEGIEVFEPSHIDECCGFGGMFAVEEQAVSVCMGRDKVKDHIATGAEYIVGADSSCLMHMQGVVYPKGRFASRKDNGYGRIFLNFGDDFIIGHHCSFFMLCVAKTTFQVTSGETDENSRSPGIISLPLQTVKDFINLSHRSLICFVRYGLFFLIFRMVFYIIRGIVFYSVLLVNDNIAFRLLYLYFIALRDLFAHPAGNILCGGIEREYFIQVLVVEFFHDHFFNTGEIYHHTVCIESCRTAVDSDNPVVTV
jgi:L-lactate dehydrogenase complex protein LldE